MGKKDRIVSAKMADPKCTPRLKMNGRLNGALNGRGKAVEESCCKSNRPTKPLAKRPKPQMSGMIVLPEGYRPSENEPFMNERAQGLFPQQVGGLEGRDRPTEPRNSAGAARG